MSKPGQNATHEHCTTFRQSYATNQGRMTISRFAIVSSPRRPPLEPFPHVQHPPADGPTCGWALLSYCIQRFVGVSDARRRLCVSIFYFSGVLPVLRPGQCELRREGCACLAWKRAKHPRDWLGFASSCLLGMKRSRYVSQRIVNSLA